MKRTYVTKIALIVILASVSIAVGEEKPHWNYTGDASPAHWSELSPEYAACSSGKSQSPIDLAGFIEADLLPIELIYPAGATEFVNNGHSVQVNFPAGNQLTVDNTVYELKQVHFHTPSENHVNGKSYPVEAHLVHAAADGTLCVVALMFSDGPENLSIARLWAQMPEKAGDKTTLRTALQATSLLPSNLDYYRFEGSLTTPPCTEGVHWLVLKHPVEISTAQVAEFAHVMHHPNNRPIQAKNGRKVLK